MSIRIQVLVHSITCFISRYFYFEIFWYMRSRQWVMYKIDCSPLFHFSSSEPKSYLRSNGCTNDSGVHVCPSVVGHHFQTFSPLEPPGQLNKFHMETLEWGEPKFVQMVLVTWPRLGMSKIFSSPVPKAPSEPIGWDSSARLSILTSVCSHFHVLYKTCLCSKSTTNWRFQACLHLIFKMCWRLNENLAWEHFITSLI